MLFYDINGTIKNVSEMTIIPREILLRDIGTQGHTDFEYNEECMTFVEDNDLLMSRHGFIHSHNSMSVFFSPEDKDELQDNVANHNVYLSLVVNNFMDMIAKVVFVGKTPSVFSCPDEDGTEYNLEIAEPEKVMFMYDCEIDMPKQEYAVSDSFKKIFSDVNKKVDEKTKANKIAAQQQNLNRGVQQHASGATGHNSWGKSDGYGQQNFNSGYQGNFDFDNRLREIEDEEPEDIEKDENQYDDFFAFCLNGGSHTLMDVVDHINDITDERAGDITVDQVVTNYTLYYESYHETEQFGTDEDEFKHCLNQFIEMCDVLAADNPWLASLAAGLRLIGNKFEELNLNKHDTNDTEV